MSKFKNNPKVSILVAIYNVEKYLRTCLDSIINQTYNNLEIILVDDGSTDNSGKIADEYSRLDSRIRVIHQKNSRLGATRNVGIRNHTGDYVVFVDSDDYLAEDFVEYMLSLFKESDVDFVGSFNAFTSRHPLQIDNDKVTVLNAEQATSEFLYPRLPLGAWNKMYKSIFILKNNLWFDDELFTGEGMRFITDASQRAKKIVLGRKKVYYYRTNNQSSATTKPDIRQGIGSFEALDSIRQNLIIKSEPVLRALDWHYWLDNFYVLRIILASKSKNINIGLYNQTKLFLHTQTIKNLKADVSILFKIRMIAISLFPIICAKITNLVKYQRIKYDKMKD